METITLSRKTQLTNEMKWKEALLAKYSIEGELADYDDAVKAIAAASTNLGLSVQELRTANEDIEGVKAEVQLACLSRTDGNGKPVATNDTARRVLLDTALAKDAGYQAALQRNRENHVNVEYYKSEIEYQGRRITAIRLTIEYKTACIRLLGL